MRKRTEEQIRAITLWNRKYEKDRREKIFDLLGRRCVHCGFYDVRALQVDHVKGGGSAERKKSGYGSYYLLKSVLEHPLDYQILCANCNWIKRSKNGENRPKIS